MVMTFSWLGVHGCCEYNLFLTGCGWVWVSVTFFGWVWVGVGECDWVGVGVGECTVYNYLFAFIKHMLNVEYF